jgi:hypothetical protein
VDDDIPADVQESLTQLLGECADALAGDDVQTARETATSARSVATNKLPEGELRDHLLHGCDRVEMLLDPEAGDEDVETDAAGEYIAAMRRRLPDAE